MSLRPKNQKRVLKPLPDFDTIKSMQDRAAGSIADEESKIPVELMLKSRHDQNRQQAARQDVLRTQKIDFDPVDDVDRSYDWFPDYTESDAQTTIQNPYPCNAMKQDSKIYFPDYSDKSFPDPYPTSYTATDNSDPTDAFKAAEATVQELYKRHPEAKGPSDKEIIDMNPLYKYTGQETPDRFHPDQAWIQTYSGRRFNPMAPIPESIVIQDIAHSLANQCRFSGHVKNFYSVAQHCVLVSYICDSQDALWGLLHDATETYLVDVPRPIKRSGKLEGYIQCEAIMQKAICLRFGLSPKEPPSVHMADTKMLSTEARDLLPNLRSDWTQPIEPLPFKIVPVPPEEAKHLYLARFFELIQVHPNNYLQYLEWEAQGKI